MTRDSEAHWSILHTRPFPVVFLTTTMYVRPCAAELLHIDDSRQVLNRAIKSLSLWAVLTLIIPVKVQTETLPAGDEGPQPETRQTREEAKPPAPVGWWLWQRASVPLVTHVLQFCGCR